MIPPGQPRSVATIACTAALVALPLLQLLPIDFDRTAGLGALPAIWLGRETLASSWRQLRMPWPGLGAWLLLALGISIFRSATPAVAATTAANWVLLVAVGLLARGLVCEDERAGDWLMGGIAVGALVGTLVATSGWWLAGGGLVPLYAHHRIFGLHLIGGAVASAAMLVRTWPSSRARWCWFVIGSVVWGGLLWTGGRAPLAAVLLAVIGWALTATKPLRRQILLSVALLLPAGLVLSALLWTDQPELGWWHAWQRTTDVSQQVTLSTFTSTRSDFWRATIAHAWQHPWFGYGPDAYRFLTPKLDGQQPHNFLLQFWLDLGALGAAPLLFYFGLWAWRGLRDTIRRRGAGAAAPWVTLVAAGMLAGLLDGVFYHLLPLFSLAVGLGIGAGSPAGGAAAPRHSIGARGFLGAAITVLVVHAGLFQIVAFQNPPATPQAARARLLHAWPSTTYGLSRWLDRWHASEPEAALAWARWAQLHSPTANYFHVYAAQLLLAKGDRAGAELELRAALAKAHWSVQPGVRDLLRMHGFPDAPVSP